jgi:hypothetical protein
MQKSNNKSLNQKEPKTFRAGYKVANMDAKTKVVIKITASLIEDKKFSIYINPFIFVQFITFGSKFC